MFPRLEDLVRLVKQRKVFKRNKKRLEVKVIGRLLYFLGHSTRKTSEVLSLFDEISHESVQKYYHSLRKIFKEPRKKRRRLIAVDETVLKVGKTRIYVWTAIDVDTMECFGIWVSTTRNSFDDMTFIKSTLKYCKNKPTFIVDKDP
jgi:transposase-like protein